jgi:ArsR family transcriptional regulator, arsenate/arsenite/antimonite-responsive transcriptional repressor
VGNVRKVRNVTTAPWADVSSFDPPAFPTFPRFLYIQPTMTASATPASAADLLLTVAEPTRLRILNCLAAAPLFVSDLQAILQLPEPTVSRHLQILRRARLVRDTPIAEFVLYRLRRETGPAGRLLSAVLETVRTDDEMRAERDRAFDRSRFPTESRV